MKKVLMLLGVVLFPAFAFALNAEAPEDETCDAKKAAFEKTVNSLPTSSVMQEILTHLVYDPQTREKRTNDQLAQLAPCYDTFVVKGMPLADFVRAHADVFRKHAEKPNFPAYDEMQNDLLEFADLVEVLSKQAALNKKVASHHEDWIIQYVVADLAIPMNSMSDTQATPKARIYKQLKVRKQPLVEYARQQAEYVSAFAPSEAAKLEIFADRVEALAK